jgi:malate dehydrogenase (oxaloacetate-decarboxylating)(NADP+)
MVGADVFVGLSVGGVVSQDMVKSMADHPVIFALANPDPEITYPDVMEVRPDAIVATGRSDYPNQVNNVLGFPFLFRGALDVGARAINEEMKIAAVEAIAGLAREEVPETVLQAYGADSLSFGPTYIIPKPFDPRVLLRVAPAVAKAATDSGVARKPLDDFEAYRERLERLQSPAKGVMRLLINKAKVDPKKVVFPEGDEPKVLHAAQILVDEGIATPVLVGNEKKIRRLIDELELELDGVIIFDQLKDPNYDDMLERLYRQRQRHGVSRAEAVSMMKHRTIYSMMMLNEGRVDGMVAGVTKNYTQTLMPALQLVGTRERTPTAAGVYIVITDDGFKFFADTTVNIDPDPETLARIAIETADMARQFDVKPRIAMLSYSNFGHSDHPSARRMSKATRLVKERRPDLVIDGEMQVDPALDPDMRGETFDFSTLEGSANVLIFPNLDAGNISYKLLKHLGNAEIIGPILLGMRCPVNVLQRASDVASIVNLTVMTVIQAQRAKVGNH